MHLLHCICSAPTSGICHVLCQSCSGSGIPCIYIGRCVAQSKVALCISALFWNPVALAIFLYTLKLSLSVRVRELVVGLATMTWPLSSVTESTAIPHHTLASLPSLLSFSLTVYCFKRWFPLRYFNAIACMITSWVGRYTFQDPVSWISSRILPKLRS